MATVESASDPRPLPPAVDRTGAMLTICNDTLPQSSLTYLAFRIAFRETLERIALADQVGCDPHEAFGFLTEVPFLRAVPAHVQLDLLAATWAKHLKHEPVAADLVDESVLYAVCETSANVVENDPDSVAGYLAGGPMDLTLSVDRLLADGLRGVHLNLASEGEFLLVSQFEDVPPEEAAALKEKFGLSDERLEPMFDVLGRWYLTPDFLGNLCGLLTGREILKTVRVLGVR